VNLEIRPLRRLSGEIRAPGDKSITHRALLLSSLAMGSSRITGYLDSGDPHATIGCLRSLGVRMDHVSPGELVVHGTGLHSWREPDDVLDCVRSGTTMRLLAGLLAGQGFYSVLTGSAQLRRRPMERITLPLRKMGAEIRGRQSGRFPPLTISDRELSGIEYAMPVASAQVKSCVLLAGLYAKGSTTVTEPAPSRDHTERMLRARGVPVLSRGLTHTLHGPAPELVALDASVPGDFSSAAYLVVGALLLPRSEVLVRGVGVNSTRAGLLDVLGQMGATIEILNQRDQGGEPVGDILVRGQELHGAEVSGSIVPRMIDEFPILAVAATQAHGTTQVRDAAELRVKETDRISALVESLRALGARVEGRPDGFDIEGPTPLRGAQVDSYGDHRLAMALAIAGLVAEGRTLIVGAECIADSFPGFEESLLRLGEGAAE
jgi:3-phosphoshikimate 1-carboxyvinyltransferase